MRISDWSSDVCSSDLTASLGCLHDILASNNISDTANAAGSWRFRGMAGEVFDVEAARRFSDARGRTGSPAPGGGDEFCYYYGCCGSAEPIGEVILLAARRNRPMRIFEHRMTLWSVGLAELNDDSGNLPVNPTFRYL